MNNTDKYLLKYVLKNLKDVSYMFHHQDETIAQRHLVDNQFYPYMAGYMAVTVDCAIANLEHALNHSE